MIMLTITCDTDAEQEQLLAAMHDGTLDAALDALGRPEFQLARREPGRPPRPFAGGGTTNTVHVPAGVTMSDVSIGGGAGGTGTFAVVHHNHGPDDPCPDDCPSLYVNPTGGPSWTERHDHRASEPCRPMCPGNPAKPGGSGGAGPSTTITITDAPPYVPPQPFQMSAEAEHLARYCSGLGCRSPFHIREKP